MYSQYKADIIEAEIVVCAFYKCEVSAWWLLLPQPYGQYDPLPNQMAMSKSTLSCSPTGRSPMVCGPVTWKPKPHACLIQSSNYSKWQ